tara:strand:- start:5357 stop:8071 length:2715 start_codon:yes stop_codon:yes gene_type:complete
MAYVLPQALVFQEFNLIPAELTNPLRACIFGGHADLHRYAESDEKADIKLGSYDPDSDTAYNWPSKASGSIVDTSYVKVFIDDAYLKFHEETEAGATVTPDGTYKNRIASSSTNFKDNGTSYARTAALLRDVKTGDRVWVRGDGEELNTYVKDVIATQVAAATGSASSDAGNVATDAGTAVSVTAGAGNTGDAVCGIDESSYKIFETGVQTDSYTVTVTQAPSSGDFTTMVVDIVSGTGDDDHLNFVPAASGTDKEFGVRGLEISFTTGAGPTDPVVGDSYTFTIDDVTTANNATSGGTYTGTKDTTYIVEVVEGAVYGTNAKIKVSTTNGIDASGPHAVSASATDVAIGNFGLQIQFDHATGLYKGDKFRFDATAAKDGNFNKLVLAHDMNATIRGATNLDLKLSIKKNIEVPANRASAAGTYNWSTTSTQITINDSIDAYDADWADSAGELQPLDVESGTIYAQYREWLQDKVGSIGALQDTGDISKLAGPLDPDNPLKWGVYKALSNSNGTYVKFTGVKDPDDTDEWSDALALAVGRDDVYGLVPLTHNKTVLDLFEGHVNSQSGATAGRWRVMWTVADADDTIEVVGATTSSDSNVVQATLSDDPDTAGTQYTRLEIASGNADLESLNVEAGDIVRYLWGTDGFGNDTYSEFVVSSVINESALLLTTAHDEAVGTAEKVEIWHTRDKNELAAAIGTNAGAWGNRRVRAVWPDNINQGGQLADGMYLAAALAGLTSGVVPHQGLTNLQVSGFDDASRSKDLFNGDQLNTMANSGVWVITQDDEGNIITRHALTTDSTDLNSREEMVVRNVDSMSYLFLNRLSPFIGRTNVTPSALDMINVEVTAAIDFLKANGYTDTLGGQLIDGEITQLRQHALLKDRVVIVVNLEIPYPMNNVEVHLVV